MRMQMPKYMGLRFCEERTQTPLPEPKTGADYVSPKSCKFGRVKACKLLYRCDVTANLE